METKVGLSFLAVLLIAAFLMGCIRQPYTITGEPLDTDVDVTPFIESGCIDTGNGVLDCSNATGWGNLSCEPLRIDDNLGGLSPKAPIAECEFMASDWTGEEGVGIVRTGCLAPFFRSYVILENGTFRQISSKEEFVRTFAPVETYEEALGFATALTNSFPMYAIEIGGDYTVFAKQIDPTYVDKTDAGYKVHLFYSQFCGCGNHPLYAVDYLVTHDGAVTELSTEKVYEDPRYAGLCVD